MRETVPWVSLFSPFPFHSVYSVEDHKKHIDWVRSIKPEALVAVKVSTPTDIDMVAVGSYHAGANVLQVDGGYGGTGAAPEIAKKSIAMPIELALPRVHRFLDQEGIRDEIVIMASGGMRTADDLAKAIALGADGGVLGTTELVALGCTRCGNCERGRGCPFGLTTTDPELSQLVEPDWGAERIGRLYASFQLRLRDILRGLGLSSVRALRGRTDLLRYVPGRAPMDRADLAEALIASARSLERPAATPIRPVEAEGGCGVIGAASNVPLPARALLQPLAQMLNRGNGKGGGIAAAGLAPEFFGVGPETLREDHLLAVAYLDGSVHPGGGVLCRADVRGGPRRGAAGR
jgi:Conserved region in glutamate synthase